MVYIIVNLEQELFDTFEPWEFIDKLPEMEMAIKEVVIHLSLVNERINFPLIVKDSIQIRFDNTLSIS